MNTFDSTLFSAIHGLAGRWFLLDWLDIFVAQYLAYILVAGFIYLLIKEKNIKKRAYAFSWAVLGVIISRGLITEVIRFIHSRPRPFEALGFDPVFSQSAESGSFPSGHMTGFAILILPTFYLNKKWGWIYLGSIIAMGIGRIYGGVHWPTDIIGGFAIALAVSYGVKRMLFKKDVIVEKKEKVNEEKIEEIAE